LGLVLHVLLTGEHPFAASLDSPASLVRAILEEEPRRMSDVVATAPAAPAGPAQPVEPFGTTPARLRRELRGDLDTIVAKALKKNPPSDTGR
jgi:serine/threonine-protein kinase